jgi:hypothetical protein
MGTIAAPRLLDEALAPNGSEIVSEIWTPPGPFREAACYAETLTAYFKPKVSARYRRVPRG